MILLSQLILEHKKNLFLFLSYSSLQKKNFLEKKNQNYPPTIPGDFISFVVVIAVLIF